MAEPSATGRQSAAQAGLAFQRLDHFTVPVRDFNVSRKFYTELLGGEITYEPVWEPFLAGRSTGAHMNVKLFREDGHLVLYWQPWGQPAADQVHPHRAFTVDGAEQFEDLLRRLDGAEIPYVLVTAAQAAAGERVKVSAYFRDPDMNQLEVVCPEYPFLPEMHVGTFDPYAQSYPWTEWRRLVPDGGAPRGPRTTRER
jgi:catechol 2,3-dioxygenase-like lactoylglutathione lyase family enzyme